MLEHLCLSTKRTASVPSLQSHGRDCLLLADRQLKESLLTCLSFSSRLPTYLPKTFQICLPESGNRDLLVVTSGNTSSSLTMAFPASPNIPTSSNTYKNGPPPHTHTHFFFMGPRFSLEPSGHVDFNSGARIPESPSRC